MRIESLLGGEGGVKVDSPTATADPPGSAVTDAPSASAAPALLEAGGFSHVEATASGGGGGSGGDRVDLVGALRLDPFNLAAHGDVAGY